MKGDFSRSSFNPHKHYSSVRMQQGRVQLDADWNEQADIVLYHLRTQLEDLLGTVGAPESRNRGFRILRAPDGDGTENSLPNFRISAGHCYVDGILCKNETDCQFTKQPDYPGADQVLQAATGEAYLVYLDVWEHHVTTLDDPDFRETALEGIDTATRTKTVWQVKLEPVDAAGLAQDDTSKRQKFLEETWQEFIRQRSRKGQLAARRGDHALIQQNQLYRVEIHHKDETRTTFKWSRENGSVAYPIVRFDNKFLFEVALSDAAELDNGKLPASIFERLGKSVKRAPSNVAEPKVTSIEVGSQWEIDVDSRSYLVLKQNTGLAVYDRLQSVIQVAQGDPDKLDLQKGDWVEIADDLSELRGITQPLLEVVEVQNDTGKITVNRSAPDATTATVNAQADLQASHSVLRRWDHRQRAGQQMADGAIVLAESAEVVLENGITVSFFDSMRLEVGDYWLIPARATLHEGAGGIIWPQDKARPHGVEHHYAPLEVIHHAAGKWARHEWKHMRFRDLPALTAEGDEHARRIATAEDKIRELTARIEALEAELRTLVRTHLYQNFRSDEILEKGDVVAMNPDKDNYVRKVNSTNATLVLGVVAEAITGDEPYRVIIHGRAQCKVIGPVNAGALLVPSQKHAGYAKEAGVYIRPGTIIGKVLQSRDEETKKTMLADVLITLS